MAHNIEKQIYRPEVAANPTSRWLAEVRKDGWLISRKRFDTEAEAEAWLDTQDGSGPMSAGVADAYTQMFHRYAQ